jgi:shikimate kinase
MKFIPYRINLAALSRFHNIYLIGMMGSGKSTLSQALGPLLDRQVIDLDREISLAGGQSISETFRVRGEEFFRNLESQVLANVARRSNAIVATGGGIVLRTGNRQLMRGGGLVVYLAAAPEVLWKRLQAADNHHRPLLEDKRRFFATWQQRLPLYRSAAHVEVDTTERDVATISEVVQECVRQRCQGGA